jgi:hypothetical protein
MKLELGKTTDNTIIRYNERSPDQLSICVANAANSTMTATTDIAEYRILKVAAKTLALIKAHPERICQRIGIPALDDVISKREYTA